MTTHVLVPLDGSDKDERALTAASALAELTGSDLRLIRVLDTPIASLSPRARMLGVLDAAHEIRGQMERSLGERAERLIADTGRAVTTEVAEAFDVPQVLVARSAEQEIAFVVMATRASGAFGRALRGSVADRVMRESPRPVLLVPPGADSSSADRIELRRVLVPLDGSRFALTAVDHLLALYRGRELEYVLLEVGTSPGNASQGLTDVADRLRASGVAAVHIRVVAYASPAAGIRHVAREEKVDFVAMSTRGLSGFKRFVLGSVTESVVRDSDVPVLLFTPSEPGVPGRHAESPPVPG